jgi:hypothetical protein
LWARMLPQWWAVAIHMYKLVSRIEDGRGASLQSAWHVAIVAIERGSAVAHRRVAGERTCVNPQMTIVPSEGRLFG